MELRKERFMTKKIEVIAPPKNFAGIKNLYNKYPTGTILQDETMACFWLVRCREVIYIGIDGAGIRGNYPESTATWGEALVDGIRNARVHCSDLSTYGIYNRDTADYVLMRCMPVESLTTEMKKYWNQLKRLMSGYKNAAVIKPEQKTMQFGVELELESDNYIESEQKRDLSSKYKELIQDVGDDGSVENGAEIRFRHPTLRGWKLDKVKSILDDAKELGLKSEWGTAGMHIHISCPNIRKATNKFADNLFTMQNILYPINARNKLIGRNGKKPTHYGVDGNIYHDQTSTFGTLEIRAWNATTNPDVFLARIRIAKAIVEFLLSDKKVSVENFFKWLPKARKKDYKFLMDTENPHEYGLNQETILAMMK